MGERKAGKWMKNGLAPVSKWFENSKFSIGMQVPVRFHPSFVYAAVTVCPALWGYRKIQERLRQMPSCHHGLESRGGECG